MRLCGKEISIGDYVKVRYEFKGGTIKGKIIKLWEGHKQAQVSSGWCFHNHDEILEHKRKER